MPGRTDRPGSDSADRPGEGGPPRSPQDELRRRLANLPANHPSSPWYRDQARPGRAERARPGRSRSEESGSARETTAERGRPGAAGGEAAAAARLAVPDGAKRGPERERRAADDALWQRAAAMHAASQARREARPKGTPVTPRDNRDPYQPWFAGSGAEDDIWLSADGTGDPWFAEGGFLDHGR